jgi:hypothetical protein
MDGVSSPKASGQDLQVLSAVIHFPVTAPGAKTGLLRRNARRLRRGIRAALIPPRFSTSFHPTLQQDAAEDDRH